MPGTSGTALGRIGAPGRHHELLRGNTRSARRGHRGLGVGLGARGLADRVAWADLALTAAGATAYELACAGVPALLIVVADNQLRVAGAFGRAGVAVWLDARARLDRQAIGDAWAEVLSHAPDAGN